MGIVPIRYRWLGLAIAVGAVAVTAAPFVVQHQQAAHAEQIRSRCVTRIRSAGTWRADIAETETGPDGEKQVVNQELLVRKPGEYRLTLKERDAQGRQIVSTTIRTRGALYSHRRNADGSTELHVYRGVHPALGVELDNLLGQTVEAVAGASQLKIAGRDTRNGRKTDKLELGPGHFIWVDQATGVPVEEQVVADGRVTHSVTIADFDDQPQVSDADFDPASLGDAESTTVEDLGFRQVAAADAAAPAIGFVPLGVSAPEGFSADVQGYVDPSLPNGDAPTEASFVSAFSRGPIGVLVTQISRPGTGDAFVPAGEDDDSFESVTVDGHRAAIFRDGARHWLVFARRNVLVTIEGELSETDMVRYAESIR